MSPSRTLLHPLTWLAVAVVTLVPGLAPRASAQSESPYTLSGNPTVQDDRMQLLREEMRERRNEIREARERARHHKSAKGSKVERVTGDDDYVGSLGNGSQAGRFGALNTLSVPLNVKANDKTGDAAGAGQAEQSLAFLGQNGLCAWNDGQGFNLTPQDVQGYGYTTNGGLTWTDAGIPLKQGTIVTWSSDPVVTVNEKTGDFYYCGLTTNTGSTNGVGVMRGHFAAGTWVPDASTMVASGPNASQFFDKQWMCADSLNGNLYVTWTLFTSTTAIYYSRSTDNGATWTAPVQISGSWENGRVSGSRPMVGPNGEVYILYTAIGPVDADSIKIAKSTNGGVTFAPSVVATTIYDNFFTGAPGFNRPRAVTFAAGAVDRSTGANRGRVYVTVQDCVNFYMDGLGGGSAKSEVESNSGFANATPFTIGQTLRGSISATTDQDWWSFPATQGSTYLFYVDSLRSASFRYTLRLYCPNDTTVLSRLAFSGAQSTTSAQNSHSLIVWTAPTTNTYYLRMVPVTVGSGANGYRIQSTAHTPDVSDVARDTRDVVAASSADGVTGWAPRQRVNDDLALYDNWLPEVAVPCDGYAYLIWYDWRDTPASCFGGSNIYMSRSTNGGGSWSPNIVTTSATTANWTQVASNIAPNQGDYNGIYGGDALGLAWADGRLGDPDVFTARVRTGFTVFCGNDTTVLAGTGLTLSLPVTNNNGMYGNTASYTFTADRNWPGLPASGTLSLAELASGLATLSIAIPDTAANGSVRLCFTVNCEGGGCAQTCCITLNVLNIATPVLASLVSASAEPGMVHVRWSVAASTPVHVYRAAEAAAWQLLATVTPDGSGKVAYDDADVALGTRYGYRLGVAQAGGEAVAGETWLTVPAGLTFALHGGRPNPTTGPLAISFTLPDAAPATLELIDLNGRRVFERSVGSMGAGFHVVPLDAGTRLPVGVYMVRLSRHGQTLHAKVSVVR